MTVCGGDQHRVVVAPGRALDLRGCERLRWIR
jgi:hypothetical protein